MPATVSGARASGGGRLALGTASPRTVAIRLWRSSGGGSICSTDSARTATAGPHFSASSVAHPSQRSRCLATTRSSRAVEPADGVGSEVLLARVPAHS